MKFAALIALTLISIYVACGQRVEEKVLSADDVGPVGLEQLVPENGLPSGFTRLTGATPDSMVPGPTASGYVAAYGKDEGVSLIFNIEAIGSSSIPKERTQSGVCTQWKEEFESECPLRDMKSPDVGFTSEAFASEGPANEAMETYVFVRNGIMVGLTLQGDKQALDNLDIGPLLRNIDEAIIDLARSN